MHIPLPHFQREEGGKGDGGLSADMSNDTFQLIAQNLAKANGAPANSIQPTDLLKQLFADSLEMVEFVMWIEEGLDVHIPEDAWKEIETVQDLVDVIDRYRH